MDEGGAKHEGGAKEHVHHSKHKVTVIREIKYIFMLTP